MIINFKIDEINRYSHSLFQILVPIKIDTRTLPIERHWIACHLKLNLLLNVIKMIDEFWGWKALSFQFRSKLPGLSPGKKWGLVFQKMGRSFSPTPLVFTRPRLTTGTQIPHKPFTNQVTKNLSHAIAPDPMLSSLIRKLLTRVINLPSWPTLESWHLALRKTGNYIKQIRVRHQHW